MSTTIAPPETAGRPTGSQSGHRTPPPNQRPAAPAPRPPRRTVAPGVTPLNVIATLSLAATTVAAGAALWRVFPDWHFLPRVVVAAVAVHGVQLLCRWRRVGLVVSFLAGLFTIAVVVATMHYGGTTFGFLPTRTTWDTAWRDIADSWTQFGSAVAPVPSEGGFAVVATMAVGAVALLSDAFAFRAYGRVEAIVPSGLLFVFASALGYDNRRLLATALWMGPAVLTVALLRAVHSEGSRPWLGTTGGRVRTVVAGALAFAALCVPVAVAAGSHVPGAGQKALIDTKNRNGDDIQVISPLVDIQSRLINSTNVEMFTVKSDRPAYWRLTALPDFNGKQWTSKEEFGSATRLEDTGVGPGVLVQQQITITNLGSRWAPAAFLPTSVSNGSSFLFDSETGTLLNESGDLAKGQTYQVVSVEPQPDAAALAAATPSDGPDPKYLQLPADYPADLVTLAQQITAGATTPYEQALALQNYFVKNFKYDVNVPWGNSNRAIEAFINAKRGFCQQFAGTYAAFARSIGLPSRVAVGFTPGDVDANGIYHVKGRHAHAWPEVWLDGAGWVLFEPTPGRGAPGTEGYTGRQPAQEGGQFDGTTADPGGGQGGNGQGAATPVTQVNTPGPRTEGQQTPNGAGAGQGATPSQPPTAPESTGGGGTNPIVLTLAVLLGLTALWVLLMPPIARVVHRRRAVRSPRDAVLDDWHQSTVALGTVGAGRRPDETPAEHARRAWRLTGIDERVLDELAHHATTAAYRPDGEVSEHTRQRADVLHRQVVKMLRNQMDWKQRVRARLDPRLAIALG